MACSQYEWKAQQCRDDIVNDRDITRKALIADLKACCSLRRGKRIHKMAMETKIDSCIYVATALINMYTRCGSIVDGRQVFDSIENPDVVTWTVIILGYADNGEGLIALDLFSKMRLRGYEANSVTFIAAIKACASLSLDQDASGKEQCRERGKQIHSEIGSHLDIYVQCTLIDMYGKCGSMVDAFCVFDGIKQPNVVSWTALILGYVENREGLTALNLFVKMRFEGCEPNLTTFVAAFKACTDVALDEDESGKSMCREWGKQLHSLIGSHSNIYVQSTLIDMYAKCSSLFDAHQVFDCVKNPDVVSWNALIMGYVENGKGVTALDLFARMRSQGCSPSFVTFVSVLKVYGYLGDLESGRKIHAEVHSKIYTGHERIATILVTCLVEFYAKCGSLREAERVFTTYPRRRNLRTWNALLAGYSHLGDNKSVFQMFERIQDAGFRPDGVTFLCILTCCSHAGLAAKGNEFFEKMLPKYGIIPNVEHYNCMVDILCRSNKLDDAIAFVQSMPLRPNAVTWTTILAACRKWDNVNIGRVASQYLMSLDNP